MSKALVICHSCKTTFFRKSSAIQPSGLTFCSHHCAAIYTNTHRINPMSIRRLERLEKQPYCNNPACNNKLQFKRIKFCSMNCRVQFAKEMNRSEVVNNIQNFFHKNSRIPIKYELKRIYSKARMVFGTWNKAIQAAGYEPNPVMFAKHYIANDGHKCDSMAEKIVDDWLYEKHVEHRVHVTYPWNNGMKCDFLISDTWVEIFGLKGILPVMMSLRKRS